jgi:hypothetical protein
MHSHWLCRETGTVLLRGQLYRERGVLFFLEPASITSNVVGGSAIQMLCFRVRENQSRTHWTELRKEVKSLSTWAVGSDTLEQLLLVLGKLETDAGLVHTLKAAHTGALLYELPCFELAFELSEGLLQSALPRLLAQQ